MLLATAVAFPLGAQDLAPAPGTPQTTASVPSAELNKNGQNDPNGNAELDFDLTSGGVPARFAQVIFTPVSNVVNNGYDPANNVKFEINTGN